MRATRALVGCAVLAAVADRGHASQLPSVAEARGLVEQLVPLPGGALLVENELGDVAETRDGGKTWRAWRGRSGDLTPTGDGALWSCAGAAPSPRPTAEVARSRDGGKTWTRRKIPIPAAPPEAALARLPARLLDVGDGGPLVLMYDLQIRRPDLARPVEAWAPVGVPVPLAARSFAGHWEGDALAHRGDFYVAAGSHIFLSKDGARTWTDRELPSFRDARLRCQGETCVALLTRGARWAGLFTVAAGKDDWTERGALFLEAPAALAPIAGTHRAPSRFLGLDVAIGDDGFYVAGIVDGGESEWGAIVRVDAQGHPHPVGDAVDGALWAIARDAQGNLWVGGHGAFRLRDGAWIALWPHGRSRR